LVTADSPARFGSGHLWFVRGNTLFAQRFDPSTQQLSGPVTRVAEDVAVAPVAAAISVSASGGAIAYWTALGQLDEAVYSDPMDLNIPAALGVLNAGIGGNRVLSEGNFGADGCGCFAREGEAKRQAINQWLRTGNAYDGVIDFEAITRDPAQPGRLLAACDSGDHLHPSDFPAEGFKLSVSESGRAEARAQAAAASSAFPPG
jgi:hypothetical protein